MIAYVQYTIIYHWCTRIAIATAYWMGTADWKWVASPATGHCSDWTCLKIIVAVYQSCPSRSRNLYIPLSKTTYRSMFMCVVFELLEIHMQISSRSGQSVWTPSLLSVSPVTLDKSGLYAGDLIWSSRWWWEWPRPEALSAESHAGQLFNHLFVHA